MYLLPVVIAHVSVIVAGQKAALVTILVMIVLLVLKGGVHQAAQSVLAVIIVEDFVGIPTVTGFLALASAPVMGV